jgi:hypothetical protein
MKPSNLALLTFLCAVLGGTGCTTVSDQEKSSAVPEWLQLAAVGGGAQSRLAPSHWPYDKYPNLREVTPKSKTVLLEAEGPGVVTLFHVSKYGGGEQDALLLRVWYDGEAKPSIEMPWMDFLGDVEARTAHFSTVYFSHVEESHNFRLPMPFRKHIRIEVENPTESKFGGYTDIQWEKVKTLPADTGYLCVDYRTGTPTIPEQKVEVCDIRGPGSIVAHWIRLQADDARTVNSDFICEGNQELYLDGSKEPQMEYLGTEDCYGFSWGMGGGIQSDHYAAIIRADRWKSGGLFTMLRCRGMDRIRFSSGCRWEINYQHEFFSTPELTKQPHLHSRASFPMPYRSAVYYYAAKP